MIQTGTLSCANPDPGFLTSALRPQREQFWSAATRRRFDSAETHAQDARATPPFAICLTAHCPLLTAHCSLPTDSATARKSDRHHL
jgi:hypothetical protein